MKTRALLLNAGLGLPLLLMGMLAHAVPIVGSSGGSFSNLSSCDNSGGDRTCRISNTSNGSNTQVQWGSTSTRNDFVDPSRLTSVDIGINTNTVGGGLGIALARLDWYNSATIATSDLNSFNVRWSLSLAFSSPSGPDPFANEAFNLTISNPINPTGDSLYGLGLGDLSSLGASLSLSGVAISNLRYSAVDGAGSGTSYFNNNVWYNSENNWSSLYILADFRDARSSVPEPTSLALFGLGMLGTALATRRRRRAVNPVG